MLSDPTSAGLEQSLQDLPRAQSIFTVAEYVGLDPVRMKTATNTLSQKQM